MVNTVINFLQFIKEKGLDDTLYHERAKIQDLEFQFSGKEVLSEKDIS